MNTEQTPQIASELLWRYVDDNAVIVSPSIGKVRVFNDVGTTIWKMLAENSSITDIQTYLVQHYEVTPEQAKADLQHFLEDLTSRDLLIWTES